MARKKKHPEHENHERWLVSYADFITLLFAFFVVMFASSQADKGKAQQVSESVRSALEGKHISAAVAAILGGTVDDQGQGNAQHKGPGGAKQKLSEKEEEKTKEEEAELAPSLHHLAEELQRELEAGQIQLTLENRGLVISLRQAAFFPSGEDSINPRTYPSIEKIAAAIAKLPNPVRLEGHTDSLPIRNSRYRSNWELSAARSIAMLDLLTTRFALPQDRLSIAGYAETAPVDSNGTDEGRGHNRRVDVVILTEEGTRGEPVRKTAAPGDAPGASPEVAHAGTGGTPARH